MFPLSNSDTQNGVSMVFKPYTCLQAGKDVVACLNEAMERLGLEMRVSALVPFLLLG